MSTTRSEHARLARAELEAIIAALSVDELSRLIALGRRMLDESPSPSAHGMHLAGALR